jgi:hypothetical protein
LRATESISVETEQYLCDIVDCRRSAIMALSCGSLERLHMGDGYTERTVPDFSRVLSNGGGGCYRALVVSLSPRVSSPLPGLRSSKLPRPPRPKHLWVIQWWPVAVSSLLRVRRAGSEYFHCIGLAVDHENSRPFVKPQSAFITKREGYGPAARSASPGRNARGERLGNASCRPPRRRAIWFNWKREPVFWLPSLAYAALRFVVAFFGTVALFFGVGGVAFFTVALSCFIGRKASTLLP